MNVNHEISILTKQLVAINSITNTEGEVVIADFIYDWLLELDYFKENPSHLIKDTLANDSFGRFNVVAMIKKKEFSQSMVGIAHFDTVDIEDYGNLKPMAFDVDKLSGYHQADENTLYGRGILDMKSAVAIWMKVIDYFTYHMDELSKNMVVAFVSDEENSSAGMKQFVHTLSKLKKEHNLDLEGAIDSDYTTSRYSNDPHHYVYFGSIGKLLVDISVITKETHASDPFLGLDPNYLMANILDELLLNPAYTDQVDQMSTPVPISLSMSNPKRQYSVKTNKIANAQVNVLTFNRNVEQWMQLLKEGVTKACEQAISKLNERFSVYSDNNYFESIPIFETFDVLFKEDVIQQKGKEDYAPSVNIQELSFNKPTVVLSLSSPYYPAHTTTKEDNKFVQQVMDAIIKNYINHIMVHPYYPYISDMSFLRSPSIEMLEQVKQYSFEKDIVDDNLWDTISLLNLPMVNIGPYGYDAHKDTERLEVSSLEWVYKVLVSLFSENND